MTTGAQMATTVHEFHYDGYSADCPECVANRESVYVECGGEPVEVGDHVFDPFCACHRCETQLVDGVRAVNAAAPATVSGGHMTTTTHTPTTTFTNRWQIASDFTAMAERGELVLHGVHVYASTNSIAAIDVHVRIHDLSTGYGLLDDPAITTSDLEEDKGHINLYVEGRYRGLRVLFYSGAHTSADLDLIRSFVDENGKPNGHLLDALVGDSREG